MQMRSPPGKQGRVERRTVSFREHRHEIVQDIEGKRSAAHGRSGHASGRSFPHRWLPHELSGAATAVVARIVGDGMVNAAPVWWESPALPDEAGNVTAAAWAVVVLGGSGDRVRGVVGPFRAPEHAHRYAHDERLRMWLVVPALCLTLPAGQQAAGVAVL
jgi:hypothetical protein